MYIPYHGGIKMAIWDEVLTERDKKVFGFYEELGCGPPTRGFGSKPALVIIDVNVAFVGDNPNEDIIEAMKRFPFSSGTEGWEAVNHTVPLIESARENNVPIIYTTGGLKAISYGNRHKDMVPLDSGEKIVDPIAPSDEDIVIYKSAPSAFFGTSLVQHLRDLDVDTVICTGCTTSGCVRASVVDAFSYHFRVGVVEECTFDRAQASHQASLFDMNAKYADVVSVGNTIEYFQTLKNATVVTT